MKRIASSLGTIIAYIGGLVILVMLSPAIIGIMVIFVTLNFYEYLWEVIRRDPKRNLEPPVFSDSTWKNAYSKASILSSFKTLTHKLAKISDSEARAVHVSHEQSLEHGTKFTTVTQTLVSQHAIAEISLELDVFEVDGEERASLLDDDARSGTAFPPATVHLKLHQPQIERTFILESNESVLFLVNLLKGSGRQAKSGQLWANLTDNNMWIVEYKANGRNYGQRSLFSNGRARMLWFDTSN